VALDRNLKREVALKEISTDRAGDLNSQSRFLREAEITGRLEHPGIVPVYVLGRDADGRPMDTLSPRNDTPAISHRELVFSMWNNPLRVSTRIRPLMATPWKSAGSISLG
jgi:serine/threonine protein kinase